MKNIIKKLFILIVGVFLLLACGKEGEKEKKVRVIKVSHVFQTNEPTHIYISQAADRINERLKGQVELQVYPNGELPSYKDAIEQVLYWRLCSRFYSISRTYVIFYNRRIYKCYK